MKIRAPNGSIVEAEQIDFEEQHNPWSTYKLKDGTILKVRTMLTDVIRMDFHNPMTGEPAYQVQSQLILRATNIPNALFRLPNMPPEKTDQEVG